MSTCICIAGINTCVKLSVLLLRIYRCCTRAVMMLPEASSLTPCSDSLGCVELWGTVLLIEVFAFWCSHLLVLGVRCPRQDFSPNCDHMMLPLCLALSGPLSPPMALEEKRWRSSLSVDLSPLSQIGPHLCSIPFGNTCLSVAFMYLLMVVPQCVHGVLPMFSWTFKVQVESLLAIQ